MSIPERADIEIFNNFVNEINKVVKLQDEKPDQIQMLVKRLSKKLRQVELILARTYSGY